MTGLYTGAPGLWGGQVGLLGGTGLSTPPGLLADAAATPLTIFGSRLMAWYDPSDISVLYQNSTLTTPVTALNDPIGGVRDKSGKNNNALQATSASRPLWKQDGNGCYNALLDGVDDSWATAAIDFSASNKIAVFAAVRKLSDAAVGALVEFSATPASNNGSFNILAPRLAPSGGPYSFLSKGTVAADAISINAAFAAPNTAVLTGIGDIANDISILRINGAQSASVVTDQGTGNFGNYPLNIGRRNGATLPLNGQIYQLFIVQGAVTAAEIAAAEAYCNSKSMAY
jgi:hypothetical protein